MKSFKKDSLNVKIYDSRKQMAEFAASDISTAIKEVLQAKTHCKIIFAAAPSQSEVLTALAEDKSIDWSMVHAFHMDEYIGLAADAPQGFANFLRRTLFNKVNFASVNCIDCTALPDEEAQRYSALLCADLIDIVVMGIGENGHIAFNDPHVANFMDTCFVKPVTLDETCRMQQVHDGCFESLDKVPKTALTLTVPALFRAKRAFCIVPAAPKAKAVYNTLNCPVEEACPATVLRRHQNATLYLDADSSKLLST